MNKTNTIKALIELSNKCSDRKLASDIRRIVSQQKETFNVNKFAVSDERSWVRITVARINCIYAGRGFKEQIVKVGSSGYLYSLIDNKGNELDRFKGSLSTLTLDQLIAFRNNAVKKRKKR